MLDELERLRAHRADQPDADEAAVARARAQLLALIGETEPAAPRVTAQRRSLARRQRRRRFVLAGAIAGAALAVAGLAGFQTATTPPSALAAELNHLAQVASGQQPLGTPGPGQYLYTESEGSHVDMTGSDSGTCYFSQVEHRETWISVNSGSAISQSEGDTAFTSAADQTACAAMGITDPASQDSSWTQRFAAGTSASLVFPTNDWSSFSTDPRTLLAQVHSLDGGPNTPAELFVNVGDLLRETDAPPAIRAALYQAAALIPGVRLLGTQTDPTGQSGVGVGFYASGQLTSELIFDPQTSVMLAEETLGADGKVTSWQSYMQQKIVDSLPNYPLYQGPNDQTTTTSSGLQPAQGSGQSTTATSTTATGS